jgi:hypothetical protein
MSEVNEAFFRYTAQDSKIHHNVLVNVGHQRVRVVREVRDASVVSQPAREQAGGFLDRDVAHE